MSGTRPLIAPMSISERAIPDTSDETVKRAARILSQPDLLVVQTNRKARLHNLKEQKRAIEADPDFASAEFLVDPRHGELTSKLEEKTSQRDKIRRHLLTFYRHPIFSGLRHGNTFGLAYAAIAAAVSAIAGSLGAMSIHNGSTEGMLIFLPVAVIGLVVSFAAPGFYRSYIAKKTANELGFRVFPQALQAFDSLNRCLNQLSQEIKTLRDREIRVNGLVLRQKRVAAELGNYESQWLEELRSIVRKSVGEKDEKPKPESTDVTLTIEDCPNIEIDVELVLEPKANLGTARWELYGRNAVLEDCTN